MDIGDRQTWMLVEVFIFLVEIYECFVIWNTSHLSDVHFTNISSQSVACLPIFFNFYFYFILLYNTVLVLPYIDMNQPQVYMSSQS